VEALRASTIAADKNPIAVRLAASQQSDSAVIGPTGQARLGLADDPRRLYSMDSFMEIVYFETSAFNYFLNKLHWESFLGTRELQKRQGRELYISPISAWELMLSRRVDSDFMLYAAQNLFSENMLATPGELITRYIRNGYPSNEINYSYFTDQDIGKIWNNMTRDNSVTMIYNQDELLEKTKVLRKISLNLSAIISYPDAKIGSEFLNDIAHVVHTVYECLEQDGFLTRLENTKYDVKVFAKIYIIWIMGIFLLGFDLYNSPIERFWEEETLNSDDPVARLMHITEKYQELLHVGPIIEMTMMSYHQLILGRKNRGLLLDSMHCIYTPYVHTILTADEDFKQLAIQETHYGKKMKHVEYINLREIPYIVKER
jgi:hypothetical protein